MPTARYLRAIRRESAPDSPEARAQSGRNVFTKHCYRVHEGFKLGELARNCKVLHEDDVATICSAATNHDIDIARLSYFAVSVFWRAAVHVWQLPIGPPSVPILLGPYESEFRRYLLGQTVFPVDAALLVWVSRFDKPSRAVSVPSSSRIFECRAHSFDVPGIRFDLFVGRTIPDDIRLLCLATGRDHPILLSTAPDDILATHVSRLSETTRISKTVQRLGKWRWSSRS